MKNLFGKTTMLTKGFTLIELLVVIVILGVLAAGILVAINPLEKIAKAKDSTRKATVSQLVNALQSYYVLKGGQYPQESNNWITALKNNGDLKNVPSSVTNDIPCAFQQNGYCYKASGTPPTEVIVYTSLESSEHPSGTTLYFLWSSATGESGIYYSTSGADLTGTSGFTFGPSPTGVNCKIIKDNCPQCGGGAYYIDPDGAGGNTAFQVYCDMTTDGGGWTLIAAAIGGDSPGSAWGGAGGIDVSDASNGNRTFRFSDNAINSIRGVSGLMRYTQSLGLSAFAIPPSSFNSAASSAPATFCEDVALSGTCYGGYSDSNTGPWGTYHGWAAASSTAVISGRNSCANKFGLSNKMCDNDHWGETGLWLKLWLR